MSIPIVECIPNFSEARRPEVVEAIMKAVKSVEGVSLLDRHSDVDHNRTVLTFAGTPDGVEEAAYRAIAKAAELIDLDHHTGEHPRIGATDVVPFVPIRGVSMADCVTIAQKLGKRVGEELSIPVYLYEEAATRPGRKNLEDIRRGEYEGLKEEIATNPERAPDFGPMRVGPAGATVIGARQFLIAYNVYLTTGDVEVAKKVAKAVRHSSGGLRYVKALGLLVEGQAQVSMNLTDFHHTPVARVVEAIHREARRYGVEVHHSELVGLIPQEALVDAAQWYLQMDQFKPDQILEYRLAAAQQEAGKISALSALTLEGFIDRLASESPTPGGGSAAAASGAAGAALVSMVARLTIGKKKYAEVDDQMQSILEKAEHLRAELTSAVQEDAESYNAVVSAFKLSQNTPEERTNRVQAIEQATLVAAQVPLETAKKAVEVMELAQQAVDMGNLNAISDGGTGAALARAALIGAGYNVRINLNCLENKAIGANLLEELDALERRAREIDLIIQKQLTERGGIFLA